MEETIMKKRTNCGKMLVPVMILVLVAGSITIFAVKKEQGRGTVHTDQSMESPQDASEREAVYSESVEKGKSEIANWPETPQAVMKSFWDAAGRKDYKTLTLLCPGSKESDFKPYYDKWTPKGVQGFGQPEPHPLKSEITLYPVKVNFPNFPNKTVKMAVVQLEDGRWIIDGQNTIWW